MRITLGQFEPVLGNKSENLKEIATIMNQASRQQADLVLFPELCLTGYFIQDVDHEMAEPIDGDSIQYIQKLCETLNVYTVIPWPELGEDGNIYNSTCLISNKGNIVGNYRKVHLYGTEKDVFTSGEDFQVFETAIGRIGIMICDDLDFPESARILNLQDADIILSPTNNMEPYQPYQDTYLKSRSMENELPIVLCNRTGHEWDLAFFGESAAYDAYGNQMIKLNSKESVETVTIPLHQERDWNLQYKQNRAPEAYRQLTKY